MWGIFEVFNTLIICLLTGLVIISSDLYLYGNTAADGAVLIINLIKIILYYFS